MSNKSTNGARVNSNRQTAMTPERIKAMKECLKVAMQIRQDLEDRVHSNSTELVAEDREQ